MGGWSGDSTTKGRAALWPAVSGLRLFVIHTGSLERFQHHGQQPCLGAVHFRLSPMRENTNTLFFFFMWFYPVFFNVGMRCQCWSPNNLLKQVIGQNQVGPNKSSMFILLFQWKCVNFHRMDWACACLARLLLSTVTANGETCETLRTTMCCWA